MDASTNGGKTVTSDPSKLTGVTVIIAVFALLLPLGTQGWWFGQGGSALWAAVVPLAAIAVHRDARKNVKDREPAIKGLALLAAVLAGSLGPLQLIETPLGTGAVGLWLLLIALGLMAWRSMELLANSSFGAHPIGGLIVPAMFGIGIIYIWEILVKALGIPQVLLPAPSQILVGALGNTDKLAADFHQTFIKSVIPGYAMGCISGLAVAVLASRISFLERGLLPLANLVSALPVVGIAPIMVMWFGFDWHSKAAVIVIMTFFPMLVNALAGLKAAGAMERDLMRSYAASPRQLLIKLQLPMALPFIFNALKINSTLALIGAIVAEFFGTPTVGMGFRISTEVGRMNIDLVWASIAVAALAGSLSYAVLALLERRATFWHPSYR